MRKNGKDLEEGRKIKKNEDRRGRMYKGVEERRYEE